MQEGQAGRLMRAAGALALVAACASSPALAQQGPWSGEQMGPHAENARPRANPHFHPLEPAEPQNPSRGRGGNGGDFDNQRHNDGHLTPEERRLLRQHIEDAVHDLYGR